MDTISQLATTATKYAFGDSTTQEPISGSQGDVTKGEPYDAGNLDPEEQQRLGQGLSAAESRSSPDGVSKSQNTGPITTATNTTNNAGFTNSQHDMSAPGRNTAHEDISSAGGITTATNRTTASGFTSPGQDMGGNARSSTSNLDSTRNTSGFDSSSSNRATSNLDSTRRTSGLDSNNSNRGTSDLNTPSDNLASQDLRRADDASSANIDSKSKPSEKPSAGGDADEPSADVSGPGPRDLSTVAREHGGDAGTHGTETAASSRKPGAGSDLPADQSQEQGTGEKYVKSSGLQADGGDFDAANPGAGREADRLMEQKGIISTSTAGKDKEAAADQHHKAPSSGSDGKEKHGLVDKIKEKLHKH